jgi:hypothetical protein
MNLASLLVYLFAGGGGHVLCDLLDHFVNVGGRRKGAFLLLGEKKLSVDYLNLKSTGLLRRRLTSLQNLNQNQNN